MNLKDLKKSLDHLCKFLSCEYDINHGGCCILAYLIALHLDKLNVKYKLVIYADSDKNTDCINEEIMNMSSYREPVNSTVGRGTCNHYCLYLKGAGLINAGSRYYNKYYIEGVKAMQLKWIYKHGCWNDWYDKNNTKIIKGIINSFFKKYEQRKEQYC